MNSCIHGMLKIKYILQININLLFFILQIFYRIKYEITACSSAHV